MIARAISVGTTATALTLVPNAGGHANYNMAISIRNPVGSTHTVFVGGIDVDTTNGFPLEASASIDIDVIGEAIFAVVAAGSQTVNIIRRGGTFSA